MKIKILVAPSLMILIIVLIIWFIYPAYTNGIDGIKEKKQQLEKQMGLMEKIDNQSNNVKKLTANLDANALENKIIFSYIPQKKEEEKIIDSLNLLARESSLSTINISLSEVADVALPAEESASISGSSFPALEQTAPVAPKVVPKRMEVDFSVVGDYQNIKSLIEKIQKLERFNKFLTLEVKILQKDDQSISESLRADMKLEFNYLEELKMLTELDVEKAIFSSGIFSDKDVSEKIKSNRSIEINNVSPGEKRGNNPFVTAN
jgi:Tfp pilus assembly protein PilO